MNRYWKIQVMSGIEIIYEKKVKYGQMTDNGVKNLIRALTAKYAHLVDDEIVSAYAKKNSKIYSDILAVHQQSNEVSGFTLSCGNNPYTTAVVVNE